MKKIFKKFLASVWFRPGTYRKSLLGPYRGTRFFISPLMKKRMIVFYKQYEKPVMAMFAQVVRPGQEVIVVGAHIGIHALYLARQVGAKGRVDAFEAWPENFQSLGKNAKANQLHHLHCHQQAVSSKPGTLHMEMGGTDGTHHVGAEGNGTVQVPSIILDTFCKENQLSPDLFLIDVEGHDLEVLKGAESVLKTHHPALIIEHHDAEFPGSLKKIKAFLEHCGYENFSVEPRHMLVQQ